MDKSHSVIQYTFFNVIRLMNYVEYKKQTLFTSSIICKKCYNYSNELCTLLQLCKKECGWIPDPHSLPCTGTINCKIVKPKQTKCHEQLEFFGIQFLACLSIRLLYIWLLVWICLHTTWLFVAFIFPHRYPVVRCSNYMTIHICNIYVNHTMLKGSIRM